MLINQSPRTFTDQQSPDGAHYPQIGSSSVGVVAAAPLVQARYVLLLAQLGTAEVMALGLSDEGAEATDLGCILMVLDDGPWREAVIFRCAELKAQRGCKVICLYDSNLEDAVRQTRNLDIFIFLKTDAPSSVIASAVVLANYVNTFTLASGVADLPAPAPGQSSTGAALTALTARQTEVLALLAEGYSNKAMARTLLLSEPTVKLHLTALRRIFNASNRTEVLSKAMKLGFLPY
jgi:DNA-binding NarL/FixJ family response regulator